MIQSDIYMEVDEHYRRRGFGSCLIHELKRARYEMGRILAARCNVMNTASRARYKRPDCCDAPAF